LGDKCEKRKRKSGGNTKKGIKNMKNRKKKRKWDVKE
jgi:hypothetical protein